MFKNARIFTLTKTVPEVFTDLSTLDMMLETEEFTEIQANEFEHLGWVPVIPGSNHFVHNVGASFVIRLRKDSKIIPPAAITKELSERVQHIESTQVRKVSSKERTEIKERIILGHLPNAMVKSEYLDALVFVNNGMMVIDTSSQKQADDFTSFLRKAIGSLPINPLITERLPSAALTEWLKTDLDQVEGYDLGKECTLIDDDGGTVSFKKKDLLDVTHEHLENGMEVQQLLLEADDNSFMITSDLVFKKIKCDYDLEEAGYESDDTHEMTSREADHFLNTMHLKTTIGQVIQYMGGISPPEEVST